MAGGVIFLVGLEGGVIRVFGAEIDGGGDIGCRCRLRLFSYCVLPSILPLWVDVFFSCSVSLRSLLVVVRAPRLL